MKVLVWSPTVNPGGGTILLSQMVRALATHPQVEHIRLAIGASALDRDQNKNLKNASVEIVPVKQLGAAVGKSELIFGIKGTGRLRYLLRTHQLPLNIA